MLQMASRLLPEVPLILVTAVATHLGSGLIDYSQKMTMAAMQIADMNV